MTAGKLEEVLRRNTTDRKTRDLNNSKSEEPILRNAESANGGAMASASL